MCGSDKLLEDAAGGLLSPLGPSPLCDYLSISDNSLLLYIVQRIMISSLRAQDPHARTPDTVSSNTGELGSNPKCPSFENHFLIFTI
jgi:hypothetical protein